MSRTCSSRAPTCGGARSRCAPRLAPAAATSFASCSPKACCSRSPARVAGVAVAWAGLQIVDHAAAGQPAAPRRRRRSTARCWPFTAVSSIVTGILFGLLPALQLSRPDVTGVLKDGGRSGTAGDRGRSRAAGWWCCKWPRRWCSRWPPGLLIRSLIELNRIDLGFNPDQRPDRAAAGAGHGLSAAGGRGAVLSPGRRPRRRRSPACAPPAPFACCRWRGRSATGRSRSKAVRTCPRRIRTATSRRSRPATSRRWG